MSCENCWYVRTHVIAHNCGMQYSTELYLLVLKKLAIAQTLSVGREGRTIGPTEIHSNVNTVNDLYCYSLKYRNLLN